MEGCPKLIKNWLGTQEGLEAAILNMKLFAIVILQTGEEVSLNLPIGRFLAASRNRSKHRMLWMKMVETGPSRPGQRIVGTQNIATTGSIDILSEGL
jgi:hypothetical protein